MAEIDEEQDTTRATNDAYTGMLAISLIALLAGCALLYLDWSQYPDREPPKVVAPKPNMELPKGDGQAAPAPGQQQPPPAPPKPPPGKQE
ncbi:MAG: hypothetical protein L0Y71_02330 [Gemmataceae bacterium]|nr:hypothetical protein [Gemmataceae bacterium]